MKPMRAMAYGLVRLVPVVGSIYLTLDHAIYQFSLSLSTTSTPTAGCISLHHLAHNYISISHINLLSPSQHHYSRLNNFIIHFVDNEIILEFILWTTNLRKQLH
jgi:hypothetical protein